MVPTKTCGQCALRQNGICPIFNKAVEAEQSACMNYLTTIVPCELCGGVILPGQMLIDITIPNERHTVCRNCKKTFGHCQSCIERQKCSFETDPSSLPKVVQQEFRQGNMISVTQVKNPSRIEITCKKGCSCFHEEIGCLKENGTCGNYKIIYEGR